MLQIFLLTISILFSQAVFAEQKTPQSLEEITATLKAKKAAMEPFNSKDVKVDLESLGLDDVDKKSAESVVTNVAKKIPDPAPTVPSLPSLPEVSEVKSLVKTSEAAVAKKMPEIDLKNKEAGKPVSTEEDRLSKISNLLQKGEKKVEDKVEQIKTEAVPTAEVPAVAAPQKTENLVKKKRTEKYINSVKKRNLKQRLEAEKRQKLYEKHRAEKAKKLRELRAQYLIKINQDLGEEVEIEPEEYVDEKIVPQKKNLNRFVSEEAPALPIMTRFRTSDNLHIPMPLTNLERQNILFDAVASGNIAFFNSAYKDIENPNLKNQIGDTILTYAILLQKYPVMAAVLARGADPNLPNELGYSPADIAIELLDSKALEILVNNKMDVNFADSFGRTSLMHAARVGFLPGVELLVSKGADVNTMDDDGFTALSIAYRHKKEVIVKFLLKSGAKTWIEKPYNPEKKTLIQELENRWK